MQTKILIVHPTTVIRQALASLIDTDINFKVASTFSNVTEAVAYLDSRQEKLDLILLDPTLEHPDVITKVIEHGQVKIILLTLDEDYPKCEAWIKMGVSGILGPDTDFSQLLKAMSKVCAGEFWIKRTIASTLLNGLVKSNRLTPEQLSISQLTQKENLVIRAFVYGGGTSLKNISKQLNISPHTLRNHLTSIYGKLGLVNRLELYVFAQQHNIG